ERHQSSLHRIRLGFLDRAFMRLAAVHIDAMAGADAFADHDAVTSECDDFDFGDIRDTPAGFFGLAYLALAFRHALDLDGLTGPSIMSEDPIGFCDNSPTLDIRNLPASLGS